MEKSDSKPSDLIQVDKVDSSNIEDLLQLIKKQAAAHDCVFSGSEDRLITDFTDPGFSGRTHLFYAANLPIAYTLDFPYQTNKGRISYLEDIYADSAGSGRRGLGTSVFDALKTESKKCLSREISFSVMEDNQRAMRFYNHHGAVSGEKYNWNLSHLLSEEGLLIQKFAKKSGLNNKAENAFSASSDFNVSSLGHHNGHHSLRMVTDSENRVLGEVFANTNYSTFRAVTGMQLEPIELKDMKKDTQKTAVLLSMMQSVIDDARQKNKTGHLYAYTKEDDIFMNKFYEALGGRLLQMNDRSTSILKTLSVPLTTDPLHQHGSSGEETFQPYL